MEEIRGVTWDLWGDELSHEQTIQRIIAAGFPVKGGVALKMFAIVEGESGEYQKAWHINVERNADGSIKRYPDADGLDQMKMLSIDLGFMQISINISPDQLILIDSGTVGPFVEDMFLKYPELAVPWDACEVAYGIWSSRGFTPWFAYKPGTDAFHLKMTYGAKAFANWLVHSFVDKKKNMDYV